jgi:transposase
VKRKNLGAFFSALPPCLVGLEACGSAHHWASELIKLGHDARIMPPAYVKPYVRRQKNDAADAAAICEAVMRPSMRFVPVRSVENQATLMHHKAREMLVSQRTQLLNGLRGHLGEIGVIAAQGPRHARQLADRIEAGDKTIPLPVCEALVPLVAQLRNLDAAIARLDRTIAKIAHEDDTARRLMTIPGVGPVTASAMVACVRTRRASRGRASLTPSSDWCPGKTLPAANNGSGASRKWAIDTYANCSWWARMPCCIIASRTRTRCGCVRRSLSRRSRSSLSP